MLFLDLDHFKEINDTLGHDAGDILLQKVVQRIRPNIRNEDIFARIGGDEFIIVLTDIEETDLIVTIHKIIDLIHQPWSIKEFELNISASIGVSLYPQDGTTAIELMKNADMAMYRSKGLGRDNFSFFTNDLDNRIHQEMQLEQEMVSALHENQFELYFQPKVRLANNEMVGAEALVRWNHPTKGIIYPEQFISLAESTGSILKLGSWVIEEGCRAIAKFNTLYSKKLFLSVNVSIRQFQQGDIYSVIKTALEKNGVDPEQFSIEITENIMIENNEKMIKKLNAIKSLGVSVCVDDFGTGYSSLSYLHRFPIDAIKIDKSFVDQISQDDDNRVVLLDAIIAMGKSLNKFVIAEGVEHEYQRQYLLKNGLEFYQGFLFAKPLDENAFIKMIS
ncbi:MAG: EAL domain-containing protein [Campylobacterales bacterium]|nr:EAL domain-containing protein [Campylobacterales bacterium]